MIGSGIDLSIPLTAEELAAVLKVSKRTVERCVSRGMPFEDWGTGGLRVQRRFDLAKCRAWASARARTHSGAGGRP